MSNRLKELFVGVRALQRTCARGTYIEGVTYWATIAWVLMLARLSRRFSARGKLSLTWNGRPFHFFIADRTGIATLEEVFVHEEYDVPDLPVPTTIIDAGANVGAASAYFACKYPNARIYAIEPCPRTIRILRKNMAQFPNVSVHEYALSDSNEELDLYVRDESSIGSSLVKRSGARPVRVQGRTLDAFMAEQALDTLDLLKFDIEGAEEKLIAGIRDMSRVRAYVGEVHDDLIASDRKAFTDSFSGYHVDITPLSASRAILRARSR